MQNDEVNDAEHAVTTLLRRAMFLGLTPLLLGTATFVAWYLTRNELLPLIGIVTIYAGVFAWVAGMIALGYFYFVSLSLKKPLLKTHALTLLALFILCVNFPVAMIYADTAIMMMRIYKVTIHNDSRETLTNVRLVGGGLDLSLGDIAPGTRLVHECWFKQDGPLRFQATTSKSSHDLELEGYVTRHMAGNCAVFVQPDGNVSIENLSRD